MQSPEYYKCLLINPQHNLFREDSDSGFGLLRHD